MVSAANSALSEPAIHDGYRVIIEPCDDRIRVIFNGETVADSQHAFLMHETRLASVYYFPLEDVRLEFLLRNDLRTHCPFKGNASYRSLKVGDRTAENAVWSYEDPYDEASIIGGYLAFDWGVMDGWFVGDNPVAEQPRRDVAARENPFVKWLIDDAWKATSAPDFVARLATALVAAEFPIWRLRLLVRTLNPQLFANAYTWQRDVAGIDEFEATHAGLQSAQYRDSPFAPILAGEGGIRRRLEGTGPKLDFPILEDLVAEGATDYVAMPVRFSDGLINILILTSDRPGGFATEELGQLYEVLPALGRQLEAYAQRVSSLTLLRTYLGRDAGKRVMDGLVQRGDGEEVHAVIWISDLRESTALANSLSRVGYLAALNQYFDCVAGAVIENGGEVLKFIGDAVLAIFPIDDKDDPHPDACLRALDAVRDAGRAIAEINAEREANSEVPLRYGTGLHRGDITYGNIGTTKRLDFTVIGTVVNEVSRIESLSKILGRPVLMSSAFADSVSSELISLGKHQLRGVVGEQEIFTLPESEEA
jgi:adenylate cyclase